MSVEAPRPGTNALDQLVSRTKHLIPPPTREKLRPLYRKIRGELRWSYPAEVISQLGDIDPRFIVHSTSEEIECLSMVDEKPFIVHHFLPLMQEGVVFADIGASIGHYSAAALIKGAQVISIEPDPISAERLVANLQLNRIRPRQYHVFEIALGDGTTDELDLQTFATRSHSSLLPQPLIPSHQKGKPSISYHVRVYTLKELVDNGKIQLPNVAKIDTEGYELQILKGMVGLPIGHLLIEIHRAHGVNPEEVYQWMNQNGYCLQGKPFQRGTETLCHFVKLS